MSRLVYVIPWAICDTENLYIKKVEQKEMELPKECDEYEDWTIQKIIPSPDRRSRDIYVLLDVYRGYDMKNRSRQVAVLDVTNSIGHLRELGYMPAKEEERSFLRQRVLGWDTPAKRNGKKK